MKLAMTMTAFKRPEYLENVLVNLANARAKADYKLYFGVEPASKEVLDVCNSVAFMPKHVHLNPKILGVRDNPYQLLKRTFDAGADGVLYLEDDLQITDDTVEMASWYFSHPDADRYLCLNLYNHDSSLSADPAALFGGDKFSALGMGITKHQWKTHFEPNWYADKRGWDFCFTNMISDGLKVLQPRISRSHHIGRFGGVHYRANMHDHLYVDNPIWTGKPVDYFIEAADAV
jgi:hypothetical protein